MKNDKINLGLLLEGCQRNNRYSQEKLYQHFFPYSISICLRYSKNIHEAKEILNEGFLKVFNKLDQYDKDYPFRAWLRRILINTAIDYYRKAQKQPFILSIDHAASIKDDASEIGDIEPSTDTLRLLQKLSPAYRIVFNLYVMEGYKHHEIAAQLGISVSTSKTNFLRAKQKLRQLIQQQTTYKINNKENG